MVNFEAKDDDVFVPSEVARGERGRGGKKAMVAFWTALQSQKLVRIGQLLAKLTPEGKSWAAIVAEGGSIILRDAITVADQFGKPVKLALVPGQVISLQNVPQWGCPACQSAHGTGKGPSGTGGVNVHRLIQNRFYYHPGNKTLFSISESCFENYVKQAKHIDRFVTVSEYAGMVPAEAQAAPAKGKAK